MFGDALLRRGLELAHLPAAAVGIGEVFTVTSFQPVSANDAFSTSIGLASRSWMPPNRMMRRAFGAARSVTFFQTRAISAEK